MQNTCTNCGAESLMIECVQQGENVCSGCGLCDPNPVYSFLPQKSKEVSGAEKHHYVRKPKRGRDFSRLLGDTSRGTGAYDRRYYWNERFGQWRNMCPLIPQKDLIKIGEPLDRRIDDTDMGRFFNSNPLHLTRDDIADLCHYAKLSKHAEKWIQIKWCLTNFPLWKYQNEIDNDYPIPIIRRTTDFDPSWPWQPNFLPEDLYYRLRRFLMDIREAFIRTQSHFHEIDYMWPYQRNSFINFDFVMMRGLYMLCDNCAWHEHGKSEECCAVKYAWALKSLSTRKNIRDHVAWFYFLVGEMAKASLYDHPSNKSVKKWEICPSDTILVSDEFKPKCPQLLEAIIPPTYHPDLAARPLRRLGTSCRPPLGLGGWVPLSAIETFPRPTSSILPFLP